MSKEGLESKIDYKLNYPQFSGRNYVVAVYDNPDNIPLWDVANFFLARWQLTKKGDLKNILRDWLTERPSLVKRLEEDDKNPVFDFDQRYLLDLGETKKDETPKKSRKILTELTTGQLFKFARQKIKEKFGSYNFMDLDYRNFFFLNDSKHPERSPHSGDIGLTAYAKPKMGGNKERRFHTIQIEGPFVDSSIPFALLSDDCKDFSFNKVKGGYTPYQMSCIEIAATLLMARYHPELVKNLRPILNDRKTKIRLPFHVHEPQQYSEDSNYTVNGSQPNFKYLMVDSVLAFILNNQPKFEISKGLTKIPVIYDPYSLGSLQEGNAGFEVVPNKYIFERRSSVELPVREWFNKIDPHYRKEGFEFKRLVVENKDSLYEAIAMEYVKGNEVRRLIFGNDPPIERKIVFGKAKPDIFFIEKQKEQPKYVNPYQQLFKPHYGRGIKVEDFDDASRRMPIFSEYRIPWFVQIPKIMLADYHKAIDSHFAGGNKNLIRWLHKRNDILENSQHSSERIDKMGMFYGISKAV